MAELAWRVATAITVLFWVLWLSGLSYGQCSIQYENTAVRYGRMAILQCPLSASVKWWRSTEQCGPFIDYTSECSATSCHIYVNSSYFYYCCTPSSVSDVLSARDEERSCFRIQVCIDLSINSRGSTVAFFNEPVQIFVEMFSEPHPQSNTTIFLTHSNESLTNNTLHTVATAVTVGDARLVWQYIVQVPDLTPSEGLMRFIANFKHENPDCEPQEVSYLIPIRRKSGPSTQTEPPLSTSEGGTCMEDSSPFSNSERVGYLTALAVVCTLCIIFLFMSISFAAYHCVRWQKQRRSSSDSCYGMTSCNNPGSYHSAGTTPMDETPAYNRENSAASTTSTQPLIRNNYERNHPLSLAMRGAFHDNNNQTNGHAATTTDGLSTPTPSVQSRLLPATPDGPPTPSSTNHTMMATINEERAEPANQTPLYAHLGDGVPLQGQQSDSSAVDV